MMRRTQNKQETMNTDPQLQMFKNDFERELSMHEKDVDDRAKAVTKIVTDLRDIQEIMKDMQNLTHTQGVLIDDISSNIDVTYENTSKANVELTKAKDNISLCSIQ